MDVQELDFLTSSPTHGLDGGECGVGEHKVWTSVFKLEEKIVGGSAQSDENCRRKAGNCHGNSIGVYHKAKLEENL